MHGIGSVADGGSVGLGEASLKVHQGGRGLNLRGGGTRGHGGAAEQSEQSESGIAKFHGEFSFAKRRVDRRMCPFIVFVSNQKGGADGNYFPAAESPAVLLLSDACPPRVAPVDKPDVFGDAGLVAAVAARPNVDRGQLRTVHCR